MPTAVISRASKIADWIWDEIFTFLIYLDTVFVTRKSEHTVLTDPSNSID